MATDPLDKVARTLGLLRRQLAQTGASSAPAGSAPAVAADAPRARSGQEPPQAQAARRIRALDPADPRWNEQASQIAVETMLLAEFGATYTNDAAFRQLMRDVTRQMRGDATLAAQLDTLLQSLRGPG